MKDKEDHDHEALVALKVRLREGKIDAHDLKVLHNLVERTERAARDLRAAIVE